MNRKKNLVGNVAFGLRTGVCLFFITFSYQCGKSIPVEEMGNAKYLVTKAESVKSDEYASEKYEASKKALFEAHDFVSNGEMDEAKEKALLSGKLAGEAFDLAAPKLAEENKKNAETLIEEADALLAAEFAEEEFKNSKDFLAEGDGHFSSGNHENAIKSYEDSAQAASKAKDIAEAQIELIRSSVVEIGDKLQRAEQYGAQEKFPEKLAKAKEILGSSNQMLEAKNYKEARSRLEEASGLAQEIFNDSLKTWAENLHKESKIYIEKVGARLQKMMEQIRKNTELKKVFDSDEEHKETLSSTQTGMNAAKEALANAEKLIADAAYLESKDESEEANRLAKIVEDQLEQITVLVARKGILVDSFGVGEEEPLGEGWKRYVVKNRPSRRDCLWRIAGYSDIYSNPRLWPRIYKANKSKIRNPDLIYPGQRFDVPPKKGGVSRTSTRENSADKKDEEASDVPSSQEGESEKQQVEESNSLGVE